MKHAVHLLGLGLGGVGMALAGAAAWFVRRPWPRTSGTLALRELSFAVEVLRDRWGVPHIYAATLHDLVMAQGYVHAQDRLWQMEFNRRIASGALSEVLGKATLEADRFLRTVGLRRAAERDVALLDDEMHLLLKAYTDGINAFVETHRTRLPLEFSILRAQPAVWSPVDTLACGKVMSFELGANREFELLYSQFLQRVGEGVTKRFIPPYPDEAPVILPHEIYDHSVHHGKVGPTQPEAVSRALGEPTPEWGSNSWVVHGNRTYSGMPLLANDTHLGFTMPCVWYTNGLHLVDIDSRGTVQRNYRRPAMQAQDFDCVGFSIPGVPFVFIGHNGYIAWGVSNLGPDVQDFYLEKLDDPDEPRRYQFRGEWRDLEVISERIAIKGEKPQQINILLTHHGPLMNEVTSNIRQMEPMALRWTGLEGSGLFQAIVRLNQARNWEDFRSALRTWDVPGQNFVYADTQGNIGYQATGKIPLRAPGHQGIVPVPGWNGKYEWQGFIPFDELPTAYNPPGDMIATANNKVVSNEYPYHLAYEWAPPHRVLRILDRLYADKRLTMEDMRDIQADTYSLAAANLRPYLLTVQPENALQAKALEYVTRWDLRYEMDRVGASIYQVWYWFLVRRAFVGELGEDLMNVYLAYAFLHIPLMEKCLAQLPDRNKMIQRSFVEAVDWLSKHYGKYPCRWQWGRLHRVTFVHQPLGRSSIRPLGFLFNGGPIPAPGDSTTINAGSFNFKQPYAMVSGATQRMIVDCNNLGCVQVVHTTGQSGHLFHPHHKDFIALWQNVAYYPLYFRRWEVEEHADATLRLQPDGYGGNNIDPFYRE